VLECIALSSGASSSASPERAGAKVVSAGGGQLYGGPLALQTSFFIIVRDDEANHVPGFFRNGWSAAASARAVRP
jgi:hypothetical protein